MKLVDRIKDPSVWHRGPITWTEERIIEAMHEHRRRYGSWPIQNDWHKRPGTARYARTEFPSDMTVYRMFGSWGEAKRRAEESWDG